MTNHLTLQTCQNKLDAKDHQYDTDEEQWLVVDEFTIKDTPSNDKSIYQYTCEKCPKAQRPEEPQWSAQK